MIKVLFATAVGALLCVSSATAATAATSGRQTTLTVYVVGTSERFINHADDRERGANKNPFNADTPAIAAAGTAKEKGKGPYPGDNAIYGFKVYSGPDLKKAIGTATYSCEYNFKKQALCEAYFDLNGGSLFASGPADFRSTTFTLAVTGGTDKYLGLRGQVASGNAANPRSKDEQRLDFTFG